MQRVTQWSLTLVWLVTFHVALAQDKQPGVELSKLEKEILELVNKERAKEKLAPLVPHEKLMQVARAHAENMARQGKMDHVLDGKDPLDRAREAGYSFPVAENAAWNQMNAEELIKAWMDSPPHKANILDKRATEAGIGVGSSGKSGPYYAMVYGWRKPP
jgi:uncharacterized protein YkwD